MARQLTPLGRVLLVVCGLSLLGYGLHKYGVFDRVREMAGELVPEAKRRDSVVPERADLPDAPDSASTASTRVVPVAMPGTGPGCAQQPEVRMLIWAWNSQMGAMFANGGAQSTRGSIMCEQGVNLRFIRQDDVSKMQEDLITFANELSRGQRNPTKGAHFVSIMGDGSAVFLKAVNDTLRRLGPDYMAKVVGSCGYSRGEDKFMGPPQWKDNPVTSRGGVVAGVLRDGDWNIAQKWLGDNQLCNNPDEKTYDPNCLNWVNAATYIDASEKYVAGYCETRPVVAGGQPTGENRRVCVQGVVTWTPGDVIVAEKKGGLVSIVSTREYSSQMPNTLIGIDRWMRNNRQTVENMLEGIYKGSDQVKSNPAAFRKAAEISAAVYNESGADAAYWEKYYRVVRERDKTGLVVELGGSSVNNLADNLLLFGLVPGSSNLFGATYKVFGDIVVAQYPDLVPSYYPVDQILDTSYVQAVARRTGGAMPEAERPTFASTEKVKQVVSRRAWQINFDSGRATFRPDAQGELDQLLRDLLVASGTAVEVHGHTDSQGDPRTNMGLSEERAFAVKSWLEQQSPVNFPSGRIRVFAHGQQNPVAPNSTPDGRARNRRVEIVLGTTGTE
jgi:outer membrane protein OmpA-like peptidoglycan-associated protein